jgi:uncharacterized protein (TIGR02611 family)
VSTASEPKDTVFHKTRAVIRRSPKVNRVYRTSVGVVGTGVTALGVVLIPLPGPGALVALGGLAILGTEFEGAKKASAAGNKAAKRAAAFVKERRAARQARE